MMEEQQNNKDFSIEDVEGYRSDDKVFSHEALVMKAMNKCIELGSKELIEGFYDESQSKDGVTKIVYKEDTRRAFIESVKSVRMIMICDFDKTIKINLKKIYIRSRAKSKQILQDQETWYGTQNYLFIQEHIPTFNPNYFDASNPYLQTYWNAFVDAELKIYRKIFEELSKLTKRLNFYQGVIDEV